MLDDWITAATKPLNTEVQQQSETRQKLLTKPPGSLGRLETLAIRLSGMQGQLQPQLNTILIVVFAADHGVAEEGVSVFPQIVTTEMVRNFARGGAAISVLARRLGAELQVVDVGTAHPPGELPGVLNQRIAAGTENFMCKPAMSNEQCHTALKRGKQAVDRARDTGVDLFIAGEMGIANSTAAAAMASALLDRQAVELAGPGTGLNQEGISHKVKVIDTAIARHAEKLDSPLAILQTLGGFEIAALSGAFIAAAQAGIPFLVDGFIASVAMLVAARLNPGVLDWSFYAHRSAEPGHDRVLEALNAEPLLDLGMRLGEGSGAAVAAAILRDACALHNQMATFSEAGVSSSE